MIVRAQPEDTISLYLDLKPNKIVDLEVAAMAAIEWSRAIKAAAKAADPASVFRVSLVAAEPGSSRWLAKIEKSAANQAAKDAKEGWENTPLILRLGVGLTVALAVTGIPTINFYMGSDGFSETELQQLEEIIQRVGDDPTVKAHQQQMFREVQRDPNIIGLGGGVPNGPQWRPQTIIPSSLFAEADGLFDQKEKQQHGERTLIKTLDVILVAPTLENAQRSWTFRQEGIPGTFNAQMKDVRFLVALEKTGIQERLRSNIPMRIQLEIREVLVGGEWKVKRRGRSVVEVLSPSPIVSEISDHSATKEK